MNPPGWLVAELPAKALLRSVLVWQPIGLLLTVCHVLLVRESIWLFPVVPVILGWLYLRASLAGIVVFFQILIYQNLIISLFSSGMDYQPTFVLLEGTNFAALCVVAAVALARLMAPPWWRELRGVIWLVLAALAMTGIYTAIGAGKAGPTSALVYFRTFASPLFAVLVGLDLGRIWGFKTIGAAFILCVALSIGLGIVEYAIPRDYYAFMNEVNYYQLKYTMQPKNNVFYLPRDIVTHFTTTFFNITGASPDESLSTFRFGGSIITPTSFAYVLAVVSVAAVSLRRSMWLLLTVPLMFLDGAKGAMLLVVLSLLLWWVWNYTGNKRLLVLAGVALCVGYIAIGIVLGLQDNDYHVVGFLGGVRSLLSNPLGHGIGVGGNMSADANAGFKMDGPGGFTQTGASFALESAVGVLFFQTGFASLMIFAVFLRLMRSEPLGERIGTRVRPVRQDILFFAVAVIMVNGVFQEEAYSPYAAGTILLLCSCIVGNGRRQHVIFSPDAHRIGYDRVAA